MGARPELPPGPAPATDAAPTELPDTVDLHGAAVLDVDTLRHLAALADRAAAAGRDIALTGVSPEAYKALHVAGIAPRFRRR